MEIAFAVAGALLSPAFQMMLEKLTSVDLVNSARQGHVLEELKKWEKMLKRLNVVLDDAEEKQIANRPVKIWLSELQDLAYDVEDVLDEFDIEVLRHKLTIASRPSTGKLRKFISACCVGLNPRTVNFSPEMKSKMQSITVRFDEITKGKDDLHLEEGGRKRTCQVRERSTTTSLVNEAHVYGREKDKIALFKLLNAETGRDEVSVIPIVGKVGIGKTTLAQLIYNDTTLKFDFKAWVSVGFDFNVSKITKTILQLKDCDGEDLDSLQVKLKEKLSKNKFLIVLDDVWTENYDDWTLFRCPFEAGAPGSRIVITTRSEGVLSKMGTIQAYFLQKLLDDDCLSIFLHHALGAINFDEHLDLEEIGEGIAKKCQGLPLTAKTLGGILRGKPNRNVWEEVLKSKIWDLPEDNGVLPALRLSYHHLPSHLKRCFSRCAVFPKDYEFSPDELVLLWMAEGLLPQSRTTKTMKEIGLEYFNELVSRSFFEECRDGRYLMHDLISDLAHFVAGETFYDLEGNQLDVEYGKIRHLSYFYWTEQTSKKLLEVAQKMQHVRTLAILPLLRDGITDVELKKLFAELKVLRFLDLSNHCITELPNSVGRLMHLRHLNLSDTSIKCLPESVSELLKLQALLLNRCNELSKLPQGIKNLVNLQYLEISLTPSLKEMPSGVGSLIHLRLLHKFIVAKGDGLRLCELKDLQHLGGNLSIRRLHNVVKVEDAKAANLKDKHRINELELEWSDDFNDSRNVQDETLVLDALKPPEDLEKLTISFFGGTRFPTWLEDQSHLKLVQLDLVSCRNSMQLPTLGQLSFLQRLYIEGAERVRSVGPEFYVYDLPFFQSLKILKFHNMMNWEHWNCGEISFPCLVQLELQNCPKLVGELPHRLPALESLHVVACPQLNDSLVSILSLYTSYIEQCNQAVLGRVLHSCSLTTLQLCRISGLGCLKKKLMQALTALTVLNVEDCSDLFNVWEDGAEIQTLTSLKRMVIRKCPNLDVFARGDQGLPCNLEFLVLDECDNLNILPNDLHSCASLMDIRIKGCPKLKFPSTGLPHTLTYLRFGDQHESDRYFFREGELHDTCTYAYFCALPGAYEPSQEEGKMNIYLSNSQQLESVLRSMVSNNIKHIYIPACLNVKVLAECKDNLIHLKDFL